MFVFNNVLFYEFKNEIKKLFDNFIINRKLVIFGTGSLADIFIKYFDLKADYFVDNNIKRHGEVFHEMLIYSPDNMKNDFENILVLIASEAHSVISKQLEEMGLICKKNFYEITDFFDILQERVVVEYACKDDYVYNKAKGPRILFDTTIVTRYNRAGGVPRVVLNLLKEGYEQKNIPFTAVQRAETNLIEPVNWLVQNDIVNNVKEGSVCKKIEYEENDILIFLDATWAHNYESYIKLIKNAKEKKVKIINGIYDLIPLLYPDVCTANYIEDFKKIMQGALQYGDGIITDSKSVADEVIDYVKENNIIIDRKFEIGWFHNGTNFIKDNNNELIKDDIRNIFKNKTFLMVGTIEARKGHETVLEAFEKLWDMGYEYNLCIAGRVGWKVEKLVERLKSHKELNKRLFLLNLPSDDELVYCYKNAKALIFASKAEGFGLPIVEAAQFSLPLILSDLPVFKEIAGDKAVYFTVSDSNSLTDTVIKWNLLDEQKQVMDSSQLKFQTWKETFYQIIDVVLHGNWYKVYN